MECPSPGGRLECKIAELSKKRSCRIADVEAKSNERLLCVACGQLSTFVPASVSKSVLYSIRQSIVPHNCHQSAGGKNSISVFGGKFGTPGGSSVGDKKELLSRAVSAQLRHGET